MARTRHLSLALSSLMLVCATTASAQESAPAEGLEPATDPGEDESSVNDDPSKADAVTTQDEDGGEVRKQRPRPTKATYPVELVWRPLSLPANMAQVSLEIGIVFGGEGDADVGARATQVLRAAYGINQDLQIGVSYGFGSERLDPPEGASGFEAGKAFSIDGIYQIWPERVAVQLSLPFYADPFAFSAVLGAPFRFNLTDTIALVGGHDLIEIALSGWPIRVADPEYNIAQAFFADTPGQQANADGAMNLNVGVAVQLKTRLALVPDLRIHVEDFDSDLIAAGAGVGLLWSKGALDLAGRAGFVDLATPESFGVTLSVAYRL